MTPQAQPPNEAGNAVSVNAAHHLGARVYAALDGRTAA